MAPLFISTRYQCPLCFDLLHQPVQLPCCQRHLCTECFERALELTSVFCGFCRKRIVGLARKKQYKVDQDLWKTIQKKYPKAAKARSDPSKADSEKLLSSIEFIDEECTKTCHQMESGGEYQPGELKQFWEEKIREHQSTIQRQEAAALEKTMNFLQTDPDYLASISAKHIPDTQRITRNNSNTSASTPTKSTQSKKNSQCSSKSPSSTSGKQQKLDSFFTKNDSKKQMPSSREVRLKRPNASSAVLPPVPKKVKSTTIKGSCIMSTRSSSKNNRKNRSTRNSNSGSKVSSKRTPWLCRKCTLENASFNIRCSMCNAMNYVSNSSSSSSN